MTRPSTSIILIIGLCKTYQLPGYVVLHDTLPEKNHEGILVAGLRSGSEPFSILLSVIPVVTVSTPLFEVAEA